MRVEMSWRERDYSHAGLAGEGLARPPRLHVMLYSSAALLLAGLHVTAFVLLHLTGRGFDRLVPVQLGLHADGSALAIVTHPLATRDPVVLLLSVLAVWMLASRAALRRGMRSIVVMYLCGNALAGGAFWIVGRIEPAWAAAGLDFPLGGLAALLLDSWPRRSDLLLAELTHVVGMKVLVACGILLTGGLLVWLRGYGALAWCAAGVAGALAAPLVSVLSGLDRCWPAQPVRRGVPARGRTSDVPPHFDGGTRTSNIESEAEPDIDDILAKISREGFARLSAEERQRLEAARQAKLKRASKT
jgi:hypothetical protein